MDPKQFYDKLIEYGEIKQVKVPKTPARREADEPDVIFRNGQEFTIDEHDNPTLGLVYKRLHPRTEACEDCQKIVTDRVVHLKLSHTPIKHWRESCQSCQRTRNPETGKFDLRCTEVGNFFNKLVNSNQSISVVKFRKPAK